MAYCEALPLNQHNIATNNLVHARTNGDLHRFTINKCMCTVNDQPKIWSDQKIHKRRAMSRSHVMIEACWQKVFCSWQRFCSAVNCPWAQSTLELFGLPGVPAGNFVGEPSRMWSSDPVSLGISRWLPEHRRFSGGMIGRMSYSSSLRLATLKSVCVTKITLCIENKHDPRSPRKYK